VRAVRTSQADETATGSPKVSGGRSLSARLRFLAPLTRDRTPGEAVAAEPPHPAVALGGGLLPRWLYIVAALMFLTQFSALLGLSWLRYQRFALTLDFGAYYQAWYLIGNGDPSPFSTVLGFPFWRNNGEFLMWLFALPAVVVDHPLVLLWMQDVALVAGCVVAFLWVRDILERQKATPSGAVNVLALMSVFLLTVNPWFLWGNAFDVHFEAPAALLLLLAGRSLYNGRVRAAVVYVGLTLLGGNLSVSLTAGLAISAILVGGRARRFGSILLPIAAAWVLSLALLGMEGGNLGLAYGHLAGDPNPDLPVSDLLRGIITHPERIGARLWEQRTNILGNLSAAGLLGLLTPLTFGVPFVAILANNLAEGAFNQVGFQNLPIYGFVTVGTVLVLLRLSRAGRHGPALSLLLAVVLVANTAGWAAVWLPRLTNQWVRVPEATASVLETLERKIPQDAQLVVSHGVSGRFSGRAAVHVLKAPGETYPVDPTRPLYAIVTPYDGLQTASVNTQLAAIAMFGDKLQAEVLSAEEGVWAFRWTPPAGRRSLTLPDDATRLPAWTVPGDAGQAVVNARSGTRAVRGNGTQGYLVSRAYWRSNPGEFRATAVLRTSRPAFFEVWNATADELLVRAMVAPSDAPASVEVDVVLPALVVDQVYRGERPFQLVPTAPLAGNDLELRLYTPGDLDAEVVEISLVRRER
jgi:hypothetical protein